MTRSRRVGPHSETMSRVPGNEIPRPLSLCTRGHRPFLALRLCSGQPRPYTSVTTARAEVEELCSWAPPAEGVHTQVRGLSPPSQTYRPQAGPLDHHEASSPPGLGGEDMPGSPSDGALPPGGGGLTPLSSRSLRLCKARRQGSSQGSVSTPSPRVSGTRLPPHCLPLLPTSAGH